ncbi:MAG: hypothetical protein K2M79_03845 [Muribaculaceae bacterium]|nr:hypothetical protein [Muribaculaceae bacterium]
MKILKILGSLLMACFLCANTVRADFSKPDFAYPRTVFSDAAAVLASGSEQERLTALMQQTVAAAAIDPQAVSVYTARVDSLAATFTQPALKALCLSYEATLFAGLAESRYSDAETALFPLPANVEDYTRSQLLYCADSLWRAAMEEATADDAPLADFPTIVEADCITQMFYPTVTGFIAVRSDNKELAAEAAEFLPRFSPAWWRCMFEAEPSKSLSQWLLMAGDDKRKAALYLAWITRTGFGSCDTNEYDALALAKMYYGNTPVGEWIDYAMQVANSPYVRTSAPALVAPGEKVELEIFSRAVAHPSVTLWRYKGIKIPEKHNLDTSYIELVTSVSSDCTPVPGQEDTTKMALTFPPSTGFYILAPSAAPLRALSSKADISIVSVVKAVPMVLSTDSLTTILAVSPYDGAPVSSCTAEESAYATARKQTQTIPLGSFKHSKGAMQMVMPSYKWDTLKKMGKRSPRVSIKVNGALQRGAECNLPVYYEPQKQAPVQLTLMTDRAVYRQGQNVAVAVIADSLKAKALKTAQDLRVELTLIDPNGNIVAADTVITDRMGRADTELTIPGDGLKGTFRVEADVLYERYSSVVTVEVAEFTAPTFEVKAGDVSRSADGTVTITGTAMGYNGMPVADASVLMRVSTAPTWRYRYENETLMSDSTRTDATGHFSFKINSSALKNDRQKFFRADINVTSPDGEIQTLRTGFSTGAPYAITINGETEWLAAEKSGTEIPVSVVDAMGRPAQHAVPLIYTLTRGSDTIFSTVSTVRKLDFSTLPVGRYTVTITGQEPGVTDTLSFNTNLYSIQRNQLPDDVSLFLPRNHFQEIHSSTVCVSVGQTKLPHIYYYILHPDGAVSMHEGSRGFTEIKLRMPDEGAECQAIISVMNNGEVHSEYLCFELTEKESVEVQTVTFRDIIEPGTVEKWTFRLTKNNKVLKQVAGIATMYSEALNTLSQYRLPYFRRAFEPRADYRIATPNGFKDYCRWSGTVLGYKGPDVSSTPSFLYVPQFYMFVKQRAMLYKSAAMANGVSGDGAVMDLYEEAAVETAEAGSVDNGRDEEIPQLREHEQLQAFWKPLLTSGPEGNVEVEFTVPDISQSWSFVAVLWDDNMRNGLVTKRIVASKKIMASVKAPQWFRAQDRAVVMCSLSNNSDEAADVQYVCEAVAPVDTDSAIARVAGVLTVAPGATEYVPLEILVPADYSSLTVRVMAQSGTHTDGEQASVAVLPSELTVTDVKTFFMSVGQEQEEVDVEGEVKDRKIDLWTNPTGIIIKALPGLYELNINTATAAASSLFRTFVSAGLLKHNPEWAEYVASIGEGPADSPSLSEDNSYKLSLLQSTPWQKAARGISARQELLKLLLEPKVVDKAISDARESLLNLQTSEGGYRWCDADAKASPWATAQVLLYSGMIHDCGFAVSDASLEASLQEAFRYYSSYVVSNQKRSNGKLHSDVTLTAICLSNPQFRTSDDAKEIIRLTLKDFQENWKHGTPGSKATEALMLKQAGKFKSASEIMTSVQQFAVKSTQWGVWFPSVKNVDAYANILRAYETILSDKEQTDDIRRYLIHRALVMPELGSSDATSLICAFLSTGTEWSLTTPDFTVETMANRMIIKRPTATAPAYGTVCTRQVMNVKDVKAAECPELSIQRQINVKQSDGSYKQFHPGKDILEAGSQVRIDLILTASDDLQYITVHDPRPAIFQPVIQQSGRRFSGGLGMYVDNVAGGTNFFITSLPRGTWHVTYDCNVISAGDYIYPAAQAQSQYQPAVTARTAAAMVATKVSLKRYTIE